MKKFVAVIPLQGQGQLQRKHYKAVGNPRLDVEESVSFPILTAFQGYVEPGERSRIIAIRMDSDNARRNFDLLKQELKEICEKRKIATVYKGNIIKNLIMDCQSYTKYRPNETTGGIFVSWRRKEELPTGA